VEATLRDFKAMEPFVLTFEHPVMVRNEMLNAKRLKTSLTKTPIFNVKDLLNVAVQGAVTTTELKNAVRESTGMGKSTFHNLLQEFKDTPGVTKDPAAAVVLCVLVAAIAIGFFQLGRPALAWMDEAPQHMTELRQRVKRICPRLARFRQAAAAVNNLDATEAEKTGEQQEGPTVEVRDSRCQSSILN
jgi:hypothetical protein